MNKSFLLFVITLFVIGVFASFVFHHQHSKKVMPWIQLKDDNLSQLFESQVDEWKTAYNGGDANDLAPLYSENARYISSHVDGLEANGRDEVIAYFQMGMSGGGHLDAISIESSEISPDLAVLYCKYQATNSGITVSGRNLIVLRKIEEKWLIVLHMTVV